MQAQVHRFTVIYTPDIRKKSKRWYDGEITFHTFNKRVMLFSSDKLLLDSAFLPHFTGLDIDEELRLETHSVQIQEKGKSSMVDLTPILKRKRPLVETQNTRMSSSSNQDNASPFAKRRATSPLRLGLSPRLAATMRTNCPIDSTSHASSPSPLSKAFSSSHRLISPYYPKSRHVAAADTISPLVLSEELEDNTAGQLSIGALHDDPICEDDT